jgi:hypothetical protein
MTWPLVIDEVDGVEVLAALDLAAKVLRVTGDTNGADHYATLGQKLADQAMPEHNPEPDDSEHNRAVYRPDTYADGTERDEFGMLTPEGWDPRA